jgi:hydroxymethylglutaryl-CoA reductase
MADPCSRNVVKSSRIPGFYRLGIGERRRLVAQLCGVDGATLAQVLTSGGLDVTAADKIVENVVGLFALPLGVATNVQVNGRDALVPMAIEEPSVIAAASNAARMVREGGGFLAESDPPVMIAQVQLFDVVEPARRQTDLEASAAELCAIADRAMPSVVARGGGSRGIEVRDLGDGMMVVHLLVDCRDAMGANVVNTVAEAVAPRVAELAGAPVGLRILSNLADRRCVRVRARVRLAALACEGFGGQAVRDGIVLASRFAERDPYRAATHNKGIMNGVDAVVMATGNDWRAVEAGAHAYAARGGRYAPLATWSVDAAGDLEGRLEMPMALGTVGGAARVHPGARLARDILGVRSATELAEVVCAVGLSTNLAALRALATEGIQKGHMALHARAVALAAGAAPEEVEQIARAIAGSGEITVDAARKLLVLAGRS